MTETKLAALGDELVKAQDALVRLVEAEDNLRHEAMRADPEWEESFRLREEFEDRVASLTAAVKKSAVVLGSTFTDGRFRVSVSQPKKLRINAKELLALFPAAKQISGLLTVEVDKSRFVKAVECGEIPEEVAKQVSKEVDYGNPRVRLTIKDAK